MRNKKLVFVMPPIEISSIKIIDTNSKIIKKIDEKLRKKMMGNKKNG